MKLFNNTSEEQREKESYKEEHKEEDRLYIPAFSAARDATSAPIDLPLRSLPPLPPPRPMPRIAIPPPIPYSRIPPIPEMAGDPLRFDVLEDEILDDPDSSATSQDADPEHENVDVQAILFYGYTGRRIFPSIKAV